MKQSVITAEQIFYQIDRLQKEERELSNALGELDQGTLPHKLLRKAYDDKVKELNQAKRAEYQVATTPEVGSI